jgi:hypothetical protein
MLKFNKLFKTTKLLTNIFLIWLLFQFIIQTFVTYKLNLHWTTWNILRMRKEIVLVWLTTIICFIIHQNKLRKHLWTKLPIKNFSIIFISTIFVTLLISLIFNDTSIGTYIMSIRYSMTGFFIFILFFVINTINPEPNTDIINKYWSIIKKLLRLSLLRRAILRIVPRLLEFVWYNQYSFEWTVDSPPPAVYYTQYNTWFVRNQFIFERPISLWFFLIALRPMFFMLFIKNRWRKNILWRWLLYGIIILSTFSRAAWIAFFIQTIILILIQYPKKLLKATLYGVLPLLLIFWTITYIGKDQIISREFSNTWHTRLILEALNKIKNRPLLGEWAGSAWPASYQLWDGKDYNPENQYLQIWIEYWLIWFLWRMLLYLYLHKIWINWYQQAIDNKTIKKNKYYWYLVFALSLWLLWLSIEWLVLHSFVDRMIVYPFMTLFGIVYAWYIRHKG